eukprot:1513570-Alexandrium_andersonii.AAC.1
MAYPSCPSTPFGSADAVPERPLLVPRAVPGAGTGIATLKKHAPPQQKLQQQKAGPEASTDPAKHKPKLAPRPP